MNMISTNREVMSALPSRASRKISPRSRFSERSFLTAAVPADAGRKRRFGFEAKLGRLCFFLLLARPDTWNVQEQFGPIHFDDGEGKQRAHTFDFLVELKCGKRRAIAVRPFQKAAKLAKSLERIAQQLVPKFFNEIVLFTDRDFTQAQAYNAERLYFARQHLDETADQKLAEYLTTSEKKISVARLCEDIGLEKGRVFSAIVRAIFASNLKLQHHERISPASILEVLS